MNNSSPFKKLSEEVLLCLPEHIRKPWEALYVRTIGNVSPLQLCVAGEFAVGKSTLLNQLLQHDLIATDLGETTSLPIMLTYGIEASAWRVDSQKNKHAVPLDAIKQYSERSGWDEEFLLVAWPAAWLEGYFLIDLPGLGGTDEAKQVIARRYLTLSDVVLYLLDGRGPTQSDILVLKELVEMGKTVHLLVARWDQVEEAIQSGQRAPDLEKWSTLLQEKTGQRIIPLPVSKKGHNLDILRRRLQQTKKKQQEHRSALFLAQARPLLHDALAWLDKESQVLEESATENIQKKKEDLRNLRHQILEERSKILQEREETYPSIEQSMEKVTQEHRSRLEKELEDRLQSFLLMVSKENEQSQWQTTQKEMHQTLREVISSFAVRFAQLDQKLASNFEPKIALGEGMVLSLPAREQVDISDLLDIAEKSALEKQLQELLEQLPISSKTKEDMEEKQQALEELEQLRNEMRREQQQIASMNLPRVMEETPGHRIGSTVGRVLGGIADIALLFLAPATVATKAASIIGQGAKAINLPIHTAKVASTLQKTLSIHRATHLPRFPILQPFLEEPPSNAPPSAGSEAAASHEEGVLLKGAGILEKLSLSYWGEKLFGAFDRSSEYTEVVDPRAAAEQRAQYERYQTQLLHLQKEHQAIQAEIDAYKDNQYAQKKHAKKKEELEKQLKELGEQQKNQQKIAEERQEAQRKKALEGTLRDLQLSLLSSFSSQAHGMKHHLFQVWKKHWQQIEQEAVEGHLAQLSTLEKDLELAPTERHNKHTETQHRKAQLQAALQQLTSPQPS